MKIVILGSAGNIGRRLMREFPEAIGVDRHDAAITCDLATTNVLTGPLGDALRSADIVIHLATVPSPEAPDDVHWEAAATALRLADACRKMGVKKLLLPSSDWAEPKVGMPSINAYGHSKRVLEAIAGLCNTAPGLEAVALRFGWVPHDESELIGAAQWLLNNYWDDARLIREVRGALGI
jgi:nucleoside-diphosphate-sugar epimerase